MATPGGVWLRHRGEQSAGIGMRRLAIKPVRRGEFHDTAEIEHHHPVTQIFHHREVVRNEQHRQAEALLQAAQQVDDLGLDGHVERGDRFIGHQHLRL